MIPHVSAVFQDLHIDQTRWAEGHVQKRAVVDRYPNSCISKLAITHYIYIHISICIVYILYYIYIYINYIISYIYILSIYIYRYWPWLIFQMLSWSHEIPDQRRRPERARPRSIFHPPQPVAPARIDPGGRWRLSTIVQYTYTVHIHVYIYIYVYVCGNIYIYIHTWCVV